MNQADPRDARRLTELLTQQRDVYQQLRELATAQSAAIHDDQPETLLHILAQRQQLITQLTDLNAQLEPFRSRWDALREQLSAGERLRVSELVDEVQMLLGKILEQDEVDSDTLKTRSQEVRGQAAGVAVGRQVNAAYAMQSYGARPARYIDRIDQEKNQA